MMESQSKFLVYCVEEYKREHHIAGGEVAAHFARHGVFDYLKQFYEALHTMSWQRVLDDIDHYVKSKA